MLCMHLKDKFNIGKEQYLQYSQIRNSIKAKNEIINNPH